MTREMSIKNADFPDAHERHWKDAELLLDKKRLANADHLYGLSAECGLKALMQAFGMQVTSFGHPEGKDKVHVERVWQRYESYRWGHPFGVRYPLPLKNYFSDWDINHRYSNRRAFSKERVESHRRGAIIVRRLVLRAKREGLL